MTRKGQAQHNWTTSEDDYLIRNAGRKPIEDICLHLGRTEKSVRNRVVRLHKQGNKISLRRYESKLKICPSCGCLRSKFTREQICEICNLQKRIDRFERDSASILSKQPAEARKHYDRAESLRGPRKPPPKKTPPKRVRAKVDMDYQQMKRTEQVALADEARMIVIKTRELNRKARRCQRICKDFVKNRDK